MHEAIRDRLALPASTSQDVLTGILRQGAQRMLARAIDAEVAEWIESHRELRDAAGQRQVVRNGRLPKRTILSGVGPIEVEQPRVLDRRPAEDAESSAPVLLRQSRHHSPGAASRSGVAGRGYPGTGLWKRGHQPRPTERRPWQTRRSSDARIQQVSRPLLSGRERGVDQREVTPSATAVFPERNEPSTDSLRYLTISKGWPRALLEELIRGGTLDGHEKSLFGRGRHWPHWCIAGEVKSRRQPWCRRASAALSCG